MPDPITGIMAAGGLAQASAASNAAQAQEDAANAQIAESKRVTEQIRSDLSPYREGGNRAYNALSYELGLGDAPENYQGISMSPAAQFALNQGISNVEAGASYRGGLYSGSSMKALENYRMGLAQADRASQLDRLTGLASSGQNAAAQTAAAETNGLSGVTNALGNIGNAQSAGAVGMGNAITGTINNGIGLYQYQQGLNNPMQQRQPMYNQGVMGNVFRPTYQQFAGGGVLY